MTPRAPLVTLDILEAVDKVAAGLADPLPSIPSSE